MEHQVKEKNESLDFIYYLVGLFSGLFTGAIIEVSCIWILVGGVLGLLTAAFFVNVLAKSSEKA